MKSHVLVKVTHEHFCLAYMKCIAKPCHRPDLFMYLSTRVECLSRGYADSPGDEVDESGSAIFVRGSQQSHATAIRPSKKKRCFSSGFL